MPRTAGRVARGRNLNLRSGARLCGAQRGGGQQPIGGQGAQQGGGHGAQPGGGGLLRGFRPT
jgi:hypothetical protein